MNRKDFAKAAAETGIYAAIIADTILTAESLKKENKRSEKERDVAFGKLLAYTNVLSAAGYDVEIGYVEKNGCRYVTECHVGVKS